MGTVNVTQFAGLANPGRWRPWSSQIQAPDASGMSSENVTSSGTSAQSTAMAASTRIVRVATDTTVRIEIGDNPTATSASMRLLADTVEYYGILPTQKVAVIDE